MLEPILACGWCGGCIEMVVASLVGGSGIAFVWPEIRRWFPKKNKCIDCGCEASSQSDNPEPSQSEA